MPVDRLIETANKNSAANKNRVLRKEYRREDQHLCIEIQPELKSGDETKNAGKWVT